MNVETLMNRGYKACRAKRYARALRYGNRLIHLNHSSGYEILALAYAGLKMPHSAISALEEGVRVAPSVWLLWELLGNHYSDQRGYRDAQRCYSEALACPRVDRSFVHFNSAIAFARAGEHDQALKALDQVTAPSFSEEVTAFRTKLHLAKERQGMPKVWFFSVTVRALPGGDMYVPGSIADVQCFVPASRLEDALPSLDHLLASECYERTDLLSARRYDPADPGDVPDFEMAVDLILQAARENKPLLGFFIHARDSAKLLHPVEEQPPRKRWWWPF